MNARPISPATGAIVGSAGAVPFGLVMLAFLLSSFPSFAWAIAIACVISGAITGATVGPCAAARPTSLRVAAAVALAILIGAPVGVAVNMQLTATSGDFVSWAIAGLALYGLPAYLVLALPAFALGMAFARRIAPERS